MVRVGLISDTHDNLPALEEALEAFRAQRVARILHAGDITTPGTLARFTGWPTVAVLGNNDKDVEALRRVAAQARITLAEFWSGRVEGLRVALVHGHEPRVLRQAIGSGAYDLVVRGHSHKREDSRVGPTRVVNPGALHRAGVHTAAILDTRTGGLEFIELPKRAR